ncbi:MAG: PAS domain-containing protein, partial [Mycobacteriales bacterium]
AKAPPIGGFDLGAAWAGCPVLDETGSVLGVCHVTNATARIWSAQDGVLLRTLAAAVAAELLAEPSSGWRRRGAVARYRAAAQFPSVMLWSTTTTGALDHVSEAWLRWRGSTVAAEIGDGWLEGVHPADRDASLAAWRVAVENRTPVAGQMRFRKTTGEYAWVLASAVPRYHGDDIFAGYLGYCVDVDEGRQLTEGTAQTVERLTARREATELRAERETTLYSLATALSRAITPEEVAATALAHIEAALGADGAAFVLRVPRSDRAYVAASSGALQIDSNSLRLLSEPVGNLIRGVMERHEAVWPSPGAGGSDRMLACVPLIWSRHCLGALTIGLGDGWLSDDEKELISSVVRRCTEALQRSRLYAVEHEIAETLQRDLLPASLPSPHGVRIFAKYRASDLPGRVGGDWYESIELSPELVWLSVGDVVGQGPRAAAVMAQLRSALQGFAIQQGGPAAALAD